MLQESSAKLNRVKKEAAHGSVVSVSVCQCVDGYRPVQRRVLQDYTPKLNRVKKKPVKNKNKNKVSINSNQITYIVEEENK